MVDKVLLLGLHHHIAASAPTDGVWEYVPVLSLRLGELDLRAECFLTRHDPKSDMCDGGSRYVVDRGSLSGSWKGGTVLQFCHVKN